MYTLFSVLYLTLIMVIVVVKLRHYVPAMGCISNKTNKPAMRIFGKIITNYGSVMF